VCREVELGHAVILSLSVLVKEEICPVLSSRVFYGEDIEEGKLEGEKRGIIKGEIKTALKLISKSASLDTILYLTDLDVDFITELKNHPNIDLDSALSLYYELQR
jgi:hypothetical protein